MSDDIPRFPRTPHMPGSAGAKTRGERLLPSADVVRILSAPVIVEEKLDGANVAISARGGTITLQSRGTPIRTGTTPPQFSYLHSWVCLRQEQLLNVLGGRYILYGEWLYARHTTSYDKLPEYFLAFDVFDRERSSFTSTLVRDEICTAMRIEQVPVIFDGILSSLEILPSLIDLSCFGPEPAEGIYIRLQNTESLLLRAKYVGPGWLPPNVIHWSKRRLQRNRLAPPVPGVAT